METGGIITDRILQRYIVVAALKQVLKFNFPVCRLVKTVSRAAPPNVMFIACFDERAGQQ
jgi:hypothetical protein